MFIGQREIESSELKEDGYVHVKFKDGSTDELHPDLFEVSKTEEVSDELTVQNAQAGKIAEPIMKVLMLYNIKYWDNQFNDWNEIDRKIRASLNMHKVFADEKVYGKERAKVRVGDISKIKTGK